MTQSSPGGTLTVRSRLTSFAVFAAILASLFTFPAPTLANHVNASDFFIFSKAVFGKALDAEGGVQCDGAQDLTASVSGSNNEIFGRIHSNADWNGGGQNNLFYAAVTYGTHDEDCTNDPGDNDYSPPPPNNGAPAELDASPAGVGTGGWPGNLGDRLNADFLTFGNDITQILGVGATCAAGTSLTNAGDITLNPVTDNNKVICNGTGKVTLSVQNATMKITIISHGLIEISGQNAHIQPADSGHGILAWTDQSSFTEEFSIKVAGSDFSIGPSILFSPRSGQDISGSEGDELCIQHIGQGQIKVQGSTSDFGPGACGPPPQNPDVSVAKSPDGGTVNAGGTATFTILVTNLGPGASNVTLADTLPNTVGGLTWSVSDDPSNACSVVGFSLTCDFLSVPDTAGLNTRTVSVSTPVDTGDCGPLNNTVTITASGDLNLVNNTDTGSITVTCPSITVVKTPDAGIVNAPGTATYGIVTTNTGNGVAEGSTLFDNLPEVAGDWAIVANPGAETAWAACAISNAVHPTFGDIGQWLSCGPESIAASPGPGHTRTVTVSTPVTTADCGPLPNNASVATTNDGAANDDGLITVQCPALSILKVADNATVNAGDDIGFSITVANSNAPGTGTAINVTLDDALPGSMALGVNWSIARVLLNGVVVVNQTVCDIDGAPPTESLDCDFGNLAPGDDYEVELTSDTSAPTGCVNTTLNNPNSLADADNHGPIESSASITVQCPALSILKVADNATVNAGDDIGFSITVANSNAPGTGTAINVTLDDALPGSMALGVNWSIARVLLNGVVVVNQTVCDIDGAPPTESLDCDFGNLAPGDDYEVELTSDTSAPTGCVNTTLNNPNSLADADNHGPIESSASITVQCPALSILKVADNATVNAGDDIGFSITVANSNAPGTGTAINVTLDDALPGSMALGVNWSIARVLLNGVVVVNQTVCDIDGVPPTESLDCDFGNLAPGDDYEVELTSDTSAPTGCVNTTLNNPNSLADADNHGPIESSASITVQCPALSILKVADNATVNAGDDIGFSITVANSNAPGTGTAINVTLDDALPGSMALGVNWSIARVLLNGVVVVNQTVCDIDGVPPTESLDCDFGNLAPGDDYEVELTSDTSAPTGCVNTTLNNPNSLADADNHGPIESSASITVQCPDLDLVKTADDDLVNAGEQIGFVLEVVNSDEEGVGVASDVTVTDLLPSGDDIDWSVVEVWINGVPVAPVDIGDFCAIAGGPPAETLTCNFGDLEPGDSAAVHVTSDTTAESCATYPNTATADASNDAVVTSNQASVTVQCPTLNVLKEADEDPIYAGEEASFTITIWNAGEGDALDVTLHDDLPVGMAWDFEIVNDPDAGDPLEEVDCNLASSIVLGGEESWSLDCDLNTVEPTDITDEIDDEIVIRVFAEETDRTDCGLMTNTAEVDASNLREMLEILGVEDPSDVLESTATITVFCPIIELEKENDAVGSVLPGTEVTYTLTLTVDDETASVTDSEAEDVVVVDVMPVGLMNPTDISNGGTFNAATRTITWNLGDLDHGEYELTYQAVVAAGVANGAVLVNEAAATSPNSQCPDLETLGPECEAESTVIVRVPTLVIDKVANAEVITISGPASAPVATPSVVTWTLSYTLANGPVTNAVITDVVPAGFTFLDALNGGTLVGGTTVTWNLGTLTASGSVSFRTTVNVATINRVTPTVNIAVIDSDQTPPDAGQDSVRVVVEPPVEAGTPTPRPPLPNTATAIGIDGQPVTVPIELLVALFLGSLGALAFANVRSSRRRSN